MSRRETVLLVSRAIAMIQIISAGMTAVFSLPAQAFLMWQNLQFNQQLLRLPNAVRRVNPSLIWTPEISVIVTLGRIVLLLLIAYVFWNCSPTIEHWLLPAESDKTEAARAI